MPSLNYTGRKKIARKNILLEIDTSSEDINTFNAEFDLSEYEFPSESRVVVEAYYQANWMRFNFGTIAQRDSPDKTNLDEFDSVEYIQFRLKVTDSSEDKILGLADKIRPFNNDTGSLSMLPVKNGDLRGAIWKVDYSDDRPILIIDKTAGDKRTFLFNREYKALVIPPVLREILIRILLYEKPLDPDDQEDWRAQWLMFSKNLNRAEYPEDAADIDDKYRWIDDVVSIFCRKYELLGKLNSSREESNE